MDISASRKEGNRSSFVTWITALGLLIPALLLLSYIYAAVIYYVPLVYLNILINIGFGFAIGYTVYLVSYFARVHRSRDRWILAAVAIILGTYFHWVAFLSAASMETFPSPGVYLSSLDWIFFPSSFFNLIGAILEYGTWSIGWMSPTPINGILLCGVWIMEVILTIIPTLKVLNSFHLPPYSQALNKWYDKYTIDQNFQVILSPKLIRQDLDQDVLGTLQNLKSGNARSYSQIHLFYLEEEEQQLLRIEKMYLPQNGKAESKVILKDYALDKEVAMQIKESFPMIRQRGIL